MKTKCVLFDRDGTLGILENSKFPNSFKPFENIKIIFDKLKNLGYIVGIISNQSSIARGTGKGYDFDTEFLSYGAQIWEICPHDDCDNCNCRKPKSGMLISIAKRLNITCEECFVIGDRLSDVTCAKNVNAKAALVLTGKGEKEKNITLATYPDMIIFNKFDEILPYLLNETTF